MGKGRKDDSGLEDIVLGDYDSQMFENELINTSCKIGEKLFLTCKGTLIRGLKIYIKYNIKSRIVF